MMIDYNNRLFRAVSNSESGEVSDETVFHFSQTGDCVHAIYQGGDVVYGSLIARADENGVLDMRYQHLNPEEAYRAFTELRARYMIGMHWGTFDLTDEPLDLPPKVLAQIVAQERADPERVRTHAIGERWHLPPRRKDDPDEGVRQLADAALSR